MRKQRQKKLLIFPLCCLLLVYNGARCTQTQANPAWEQENTVRKPFGHTPEIAQQFKISKSDPQSFAKRLKQILSRYKWWIAGGSAAVLTTVLAIIYYRRTHPSTVPLQSVEPVYTGVSTTGQPITGQPITGQPITGLPQVFPGEQTGAEVPVPTADIPTGPPPPPEPIAFPNDLRDQFVGIVSQQSFDKRMIQALEICVQAYTQQPITIDANTFDLIIMNLNATLPTTIREKNYSLIHLIYTILTLLTKETTTITGSSVVLETNKEHAQKNLSDVAYALDYLNRIAEIKTQLQEAQSLEVLNKLSKEVAQPSWPEIYDTERKSLQKNINQLIDIQNFLIQQDPNKIATKHATSPENDNKILVQGQAPITKSLTWQTTKDGITINWAQVPVLYQAQKGEYTNYCGFYCYFNAMIFATLTNEPTLKEAQTKLLANGLQERTSTFIPFFTKALQDIAERRSLNPKDLLQPSAGNIFDPEFDIPNISNIGYDELLYLEQQFNGKVQNLISTSALDPDGSLSIFINKHQMTPTSSWESYIVFDGNAHWYAMALKKQDDNLLAIVGNSLAHSLAPKEAKIIQL